MSKLIAVLSLCLLSSCASGSTRPEPVPNRQLECGERVIDFTWCGDGGHLVLLTAPMEDDYVPKQYKLRHGDALSTITECRK